MNMDEIKAVYFVGAGGIGMSALIRYFLFNNKKVGGYDRVRTDLTESLKLEGALIHYEDDVNSIPDIFKDPTHTLIVYTPAIPDNHSELTFFRNNNFEIMKRAQLLGLITRHNRSLCVAGTHGKTTTSSMLAHILKQSHLDCNAFLGGILKNYDSNLMLSSNSDLAVIEADEFDRSFHWLSPYMAVITAVDPDHLDIYGTEAAYRESFAKFVSLINPQGCLVIRKGIQLDTSGFKGKIYTYSAVDGGDFHAEDIRIGNGDIIFDFVGPDVRIEDVYLGVPVKINIENGVAAMALAWLNGAAAKEIKAAMATFRGARRRFDFHLKTDKVVLIDDYAHHPAEIKASILSVRELYPDRKITGIFQPHLYTRTRDFAADFATSLSLLDELILLDIYPAREEPIPGVSSEIIFNKVAIENKHLLKMSELIDFMSSKSYDIVLMLGAGNIERLIDPVKEVLSNQAKS